MAKARAIDRRRKTVGNIKKITRTMQLIATARFQKSLNQAISTKPYTQKITELVQQVSASGGEISHPLLNENTEADKQLLLLLTSNRGLCGGYNANIIRAATSTIIDSQQEGVATDLHVVGKKGMNYFKFLGQEMHGTYPDLPDAPSFHQIEPIATAFMREYEEGNFRSVRVAYMRFVSTAKQVPEVIQLLPIRQEATTDQGAEATTSGGEATYDFSPGPNELLAELLPVTVKVRLFQCFNDAVVSENVARMVAMKSATDAAGEMGKLLAQQYNRARQSQITMELLDIMGGVEALK